MHSVLDTHVTKLQEHFMKHDVVAVNILPVTTPTPPEKLRNAFADASWHTDVSDSKVITKPMLQLLGRLGNSDEWRVVARSLRSAAQVPVSGYQVGHDLCDQGGRRREKHSTHRFTRTLGSIIRRR